MSSFDAPVYDYKKDAKILSDFINQFKIVKDASTDGELEDFVESYKYKELLQEIANRRKNTLAIELDDLIEWSTTGAELAEKIEQNTLRYLEIFYDTIDELIPMSSCPNLDVIDILLQQRRSRLEELEDQTQAQDENNPTNPNQQGNGTNQNIVKQKADTVQLPNALQRRYELVFHAARSTYPQQLRNVKANCIGKLIKLQGIVVRMSEVKPLLTIATYTCQECGHENYQEVKSREFMPLNQCGSRSCMQRKLKGTLELQSRGSKFTKFQEIKIQELVCSS